MKIKFETCAIGRAQRLKELGVLQESSWTFTEKSTKQSVAIFTTEELTKMNGGTNGINQDIFGTYYRRIRYNKDIFDEEFESYDDLSEALSVKLIDALESGYLDKKTVNNRLKRWRLSSIGCLK